MENSYQYSVITSIVWLKEEKGKKGRKKMKGNKYDSKWFGKGLKAIEDRK